MYGVLYHCGLYQDKELCTVYYLCMLNYSSVHKETGLLFFKIQGCNHRIVEGRDLQGYLVQAPLEAGHSTLNWNAIEIGCKWRFSKIHTPHHHDISLCKGDGMMSARYQQKVKIILHIGMGLHQWKGCILWTGKELIRGLVDTLNKFKSPGPDYMWQDTDGTGKCYFGTFW